LKHAGKVASGASQPGGVDEIEHVGNRDGCEDKYDDYDDHQLGQRKTCFEPAGSSWTFGCLAHSLFHPGYDDVC
jgi:hypothetical protein